MSYFINILKKGIVFLGYNTIKRRFIGTGFLIDVEGITYLVTAKHVIKNSVENLCVFFNLIGGGIGEHNLNDMKKKLNIDWILHKNNDIDIALIPYLIEDFDDSAKIDKSYFKETKDLTELTDIFYLSYQPGLSKETKILPIVRKGTICFINKEEGIIYIDGFSFPGNSGSPVFTDPPPFRVRGKQLVPGREHLLLSFIGVLGAYIPYRDVAISTQTGRPRITFEENTGIAKVWSYDYIKEIINLPIFTKQHEKIKTIILKKE